MKPLSLLCTAVVAGEDEEAGLNGLNCRNGLNANQTATGASKPIKPARSYLGGHGIGDQSRGNFRGVIGASAPGGLRSGGELRKIGPEN